MKKRILILFIIFFLLNFGQSCKPEHFSIIDVDFNAALIKENKYNDKKQIVFNCTSSIKDKLIFIISYKTEYLYGQNFNFGNACYATTVPKVNDNSLLRNTFSITFDKSFIYNGETIPSLTNFYEYEDITSEIDEYENYMAFCGKGADIVLEFSDNFYNKSVFDSTGEYLVTFSCKTSDGKTFDKQIPIKFEK